MPSSSATSTIHRPCSFSAATFGSLTSSSDSASVNHSPASLENRVDLPRPCAPSRMSMWSNLHPGSLALRTAAQSVLRVTART